MTLRLQKFLAQAGIASRRSAEKLIAEGRVKVNGVTVTALGTKVEPSDQVHVDGELVGSKERFVYLQLNKPAGYITTVRDTHSRPTVMELLRHLDVRVYPVGRLDQATEGLLLLTNDGELAHGLLHPTRHVPKTYLVEVSGMVSGAAVGELECGMWLGDGWTAPTRVQSLAHTAVGTTFTITLHEGKNRQIRRMCSLLGHEVVYLKRLSLGPLTLGDLASGAYRHLTTEEIASLYDIVF